MTNIKTGFEEQKGDDSNQENHDEVFNQPQNPMVNNGLVNIENIQQMRNFVHPIFPDILDGVFDFNDLEIEALEIFGQTPSEESKQVEPTNLVNVMEVQTLNGENIRREETDLFEPNPATNRRNNSPDIQ
jgi:hypothetical protein